MKLDLFYTVKLLLSFNYQVAVHKKMWKRKPRLLLMIWAPAGKAPEQMLKRWTGEQ